MLALIACLLAQLPPAEAPVTPQTAEEFCETVYANRLKKINALQAALAELPKKNDWGKLSAEARKKLEKPYLDQIAATKANREIDWVVTSGAKAKPAEVFRLPRTHRTLAINDQFKVVKVIDAASVVAKATKESTELVPGEKRASRTLIRVHDELVIDQLKSGEFLDTPGATLKLSGLWYRTDSLKLDGKTYVRIARWPHEEQARKIWPKFLKAKEAPAKPAA